ncbi:MAG: SEC-C domain-containing protein, partial [Clostridia bacterium]|nr:SEC-C domain-containing protein [Clostridia bacterium]
IYKTELAKFNAVIDEVVKAHEKGQPVLIGTVSIEKSELLSKLLRKRGIAHNVLNAKFHEKEAEIVAQAGKLGAVTIATNMAGRGTDIVLGGNAEFMAKDEMRKQGFSEELIVQATGFADTQDEEVLNARKIYQELYNNFKEQIAPEQKAVLEAGGLYILGTERHESRRIDNQLRGRSGRQGDNGASKFYLSLQDDLMRLFAPERIKSIMDTLGMDENEAIESKMLSGAIESAQQRVEGRNFDIRKHVLQYDDVNNQQRETIYEQRNRVLNGENMKDYIMNMIKSVVDDIIQLHTGESSIPEEWDWNALKEHINLVFGELSQLAFDISEHEMDHMTKESLGERLIEVIYSKYAEKENEFGENMREIERVLLLRVVDQKWMAHIDNMEQLRQGINLRAYAQRDPVVEYKFEAMDMFEEMIASIKEETVKLLFHVVPQTKIERTQVAKPVAENLGGDGTVKKQPVRRTANIGRNDLCPCGSGKKYKHCCLGKEQQS